MFFSFEIKYSSKHFHRKAFDCSEEKRLDDKLLDILLPHGGQRWNLLAVECLNLPDENLVTHTSIHIVL